MDDDAFHELALSDQLHHILGTEGFVLLTERFGGLRVYIPKAAKGSELVDELSIQIVSTLSAHFGGDYLRVPLAREERTVFYHQKGWSNRRIAKIFGITENGMMRMITRLRKDGRLSAAGENDAIAGEGAA